MISVIIGTFGSKQWEARGELTAQTVYNQVLPAASVHHIHGENLAQARNIGAVEAEGEWLCFLDADDFLCTSYLYYMDKSLPDYDALIQPSTVYWSKGVAESEPFLIEPKASLSEGNWMVIGTLIRKDQFLRLGGFDPELPIYEDWDLWIRAYQEGASLLQEERAIYNVNRSDGGRNEALEHQQKYFYQIRDTHFPE